MSEDLAELCAGFHELEKAAMGREWTFPKGHFVNCLDITSPDLRSILQAKQA